MHLIDYKYQASGQITGQVVAAIEGVLIHRGDLSAMVARGGGLSVQSGLLLKQFHPTIEIHRHGAVVPHHHWQ